MKKSFDFYRVINQRIYLAIDQEEGYEKYLKRI